MDVSYFNFYGFWWLQVYSVPSLYNVPARERLLAELPRVHKELSAVGVASKSFKTSITFDLSIHDRRIPSPLCKSDTLI